MENNKPREFQLKLPQMEKCIHSEGLGRNGIDVRSASEYGSFNVTRALAKHAKRRLEVDKVEKITN